MTQFSTSQGEAPGKSLRNPGCDFHDRESPTEIEFPEQWAQRGEIESDQTNAGFDGWPDSRLDQLDFRRFVSKMKQLNEEHVLLTEHIFWGQQLDEIRDSAKY